MDLQLTAGHIHQATNVSGAVATIWATPWPDRWFVGLIGYPSRATEEPVAGAEVAQVLEGWGFRPAERWRHWRGPLHSENPTLESIRRALPERTRPPSARPERPERPEPEPVHAAAALSPLQMAELVQAAQVDVGHCPRCGQPLTEAQRSPGGWRHCQRCQRGWRVEAGPASPRVVTRAWDQGGTNAARPRAGPG